MSNNPDTNQASELYELCKKVYELTEWSDTLVKHSKDKHAPNSLVIETVYEKYVGVYENTVGCDECEGEYTLEGLTPLYTSDYLLEKLPNVINYHSETSSKTILGLFRLVHCESGQWLATYSKLKLDCYADTPLKALLKLTIALSEAGELK